MLFCHNDFFVMKTFRNKIASRQSPRKIRALNRGYGTMSVRRTHEPSNSLYDGGLWLKPESNKNVKGIWTICVEIKMGRSRSHSHLNNGIFFIIQTATHHKNEKRRKNEHVVDGCATVFRMVDTLV